MNEYTMSEDALKARREYLREYQKNYRKMHPDKYKASKKPIPTEKMRQYNRNKWENKARKVYGEAYVPPKPDEEYSPQAVTVRREYQKEYRRRCPDVHKRAVVRYWEKKASERCNK